MARPGSRTPYEIVREVQIKRKMICADDNIIIILFISDMCCLLQLPVLFRGLGKRVLKMYLDIFFDVVFYAAVRFIFFTGPLIFFQHYPHSAAHFVKFYEFCHAVIIKCTECHGYRIK